MAIPDLNMILQLIILATLLIGIYYVKRIKKNFVKHRLFMGGAIILNVVSIFLIMGSSFLVFLPYMIKEFYEITSFTTLIHGITGSLGIILGLVFLFKHPRNLRLWMKVTVTLWIIALLLGIAFYVNFYML